MLNHTILSVLVISIGILSLSKSFQEVNSFLDYTDNPSFNAKWIKP